MTGAELTALSIADLQRLLRRKEISPTEALEALIERIGQIDEKIGAYLSSMKNRRAKKPDAQTSICRLAACRLR